MDETRGRSLSIGEFAGATQLTPKALRLYDEQGLLRPASTDPATGYRHYATGQVAAGRLIRALRDMGLSLSQIARLLNVEPSQRAWVLREFSHEAEQRFVREKAAYQAALAMLHGPRVGESLLIEAVTQNARGVSVWGFDADRRTFIQRYFDQEARALERLEEANLAAAGPVSCALADPLADDEGHLELLLPIASTGGAHGITTREIAAGNYARVAQSETHVDGFAPAIDALFDWFDRRGLSAVDAPEVTLTRGDRGVAATVQWAYVQPSSTP
jgi:DNA-binding transcriptional MerR regulator